MRPKSRNGITERKSRMPYNHKPLTTRMRNQHCTNAGCPVCVYNEAHPPTGLLRAFRYLFMGR